jgi:hypothetical protein
VQLPWYEFKVAASAFNCTGEGGASALGTADTLVFQNLEENGDLAFCLDQIYIS